MGWLLRPGLWPKMLKTRVLQIFCESVLHIWLPLDGKLDTARVLATLSKMALVFLFYLGVDCPAVDFCPVVVREH